jgi:hypothetical protein
MSNYYFIDGYEGERLSEALAFFENKANVNVPSVWLLLRILARSYIAATLLRNFGFFKTEKDFSILGKFTPSELPNPQCSFQYSEV